MHSLFNRFLLLKFAVFPQGIGRYQTMSLRSVILLNFAFAVTYYISARLGLQMQFVGSQATPVWPPSGIAIGAILLFGARILPGVYLAAVCGNLMDFYVKGTLGTGAVMASMLIGIGNAGEAWLAGLLLRSRLGDSFISDTPPNVMTFVVGILFSCVLSASVGVVSLTTFGFLPFRAIPSVFVTWWVGDIVGALLFTPPLLFFLGSGEAWAPTTKTILMPLAGLAVLSAMTFLSWGSWPLFTSQACLLLPVLMLLTLRYGRVLMVLAVPMISAFAVIGTINATGPFARADSNVALILSQVFVGVLVVSLLLLDAIHHEGQSAIKALAEANLLLEQRVSKRTKQLETTNLELLRSNKELDDFAYIASHDLKEPLRGIQNQLAFVFEDYGAQLSPEVQDRLNKIPPIALHLEQLIQTLLYFSRVGRIDMAIATVDLNLVVDDVLRSLAGRITSEKIEVRRPVRLPVTRCDHARIGEVFRNLLSNAIKYNDKSERWVELGVVLKNGETIFYVEDNGIGIKERHYERVFQIFRSLHNPEKFGVGTGAGMTICQKIVERHGGRIWIESSYGEGSRFCFTLKAT